MSMQPFSSNVNVNHLATNNVNVPSNRKTKVYQVRETATKIAARLNDPNSFSFYCKVAWELPEAKIWAALEQSLLKRKPAAYFTAICKADMK